MMTPEEDWDERAPKNKHGWHLDNVDIKLMRMPGHLFLDVSAIIDDPRHGAPYEETGPRLVSLRIDDDVDTHLNLNIGNRFKLERSWKNWDDGQLEEDGHRFSERVQKWIKRNAELGLDIVRETGD